MSDSNQDAARQTPGQPAAMEDRRGLICGIGAYTLWGVFPITTVRVLKGRTLD
jgi:EamA domain-containing membrane protein RarD